MIERKVRKDADGSVSQMTGISWKKGYRSGKGSFPCS